MDARQRKSNPANTRDLLSALRHYEEHEPKRKLVHIGASANMDQSTIYRFEAGQSIPRELDAVVAAYADDLDTTPRAI